jgi:hypothetical protein
VHPELRPRSRRAQGAEGRERGGKPLDGFEIVAAVPGALTDDPPTAHEAIRGELPTHFSLPFYGTTIEASGYRADIAAFDGRRATPPECVTRAAARTRRVRLQTRVPRLHGGPICQTAIRCPADFLELPGSRCSSRRKGDAPSAGLCCLAAGTPIT